MQPQHGFLRAVLGVILNAFLDLLWLLGFAHPDRKARSGWRAAVVMFLGVLFVAALIAGWVPLEFLIGKAAVATWVAVVVIGTFGAVLVIGALAVVFQVLFLLWRGRRVTAAVVGEDDLVANPRFHFAADSGQEQVVSGAVVSVSRRYHGGEQVPLLYLPGRPGMFVVDRFGDKWGVPFMVLVLGLILLLPPLVFVFDLMPFILKRGHLFTPLMFLLVGGIFSALGLTAAVRAIRFRRRAAEAAGVIVEAKRLRDAWAERARQEGKTVLTELPPAGPGQSEWWVLAVEFEDATGARRRGVAEVPRREPPQVGDPFPVRYDPEHPAAIRPGSSLEWIGPLLVGAIGSALVAVGVLLWCRLLP